MKIEDYGFLSDTQTAALVEAMRAIEAEALLCHNHGIKLGFVTYALQTSRAALALFAPQE